MNRVIKDSIWDSPTLAKLSQYHQDQFPRWILMADDWGCFKANPRVIEGKVYPMREETPEDVLQTREIYYKAGILFVWKKDGREWGFFVKWNKHEFCSRGRKDEEGKLVKNRRKTPEPPKEELEKYLKDYPQENEEVENSVSKKGTKRNKVEQKGTKRNKKKQNDAKCSNSNSNSNSKGGAVEKDNDSAPKKSKKKKTKKKKDWRGTSEFYLAHNLGETILFKKPNYKRILDEKDNNYKKWCEDINKLLVWLEEKSEPFNLEEMIEIIDWAVNVNEYWEGIIVSGKSFANNYQDLREEYYRKTGKSEELERELTREEISDPPPKRDSIQDYIDEPYRLSWFKNKPQVVESYLRDIKERLSDKFEEWYEKNKDEIGEHDIKKV